MSQDAETFVALTEDDIAARFAPLMARRKRAASKRERAALREERRRNSEQLSMKLAEARLTRKMEQQGQCKTGVKILKD